jgi:hypothetical protein
VPDERTQESANDAICDHEPAGAELVRRRKSNREHMRRRRADPAHRARSGKTQVPASCSERWRRVTVVKCRATDRARLRDLPPTRGSRGDHSARTFEFHTWRLCTSSLALLRALLRLPSKSSASHFGATSVESF